MVDEVLRPILHVGVFARGLLVREDRVDVEASANRVLDAITTALRTISGSGYPGTELLSGEPEYRLIGGLSNDVEQLWADAAAKRGWTLCPVRPFADGESAPIAQEAGPVGCDFLLGQSDILIAVGRTDAPERSSDAVWLRRGARERGLPILDVHCGRGGGVTLVGSSGAWRQELATEIGRVLLPGYGPTRRDDIEAKRAADEVRLFFRTHRAAPFFKRLYRSYEGLLLLGSRRIVERPKASSPGQLVLPPPKVATAETTAGASPFESLEARLTPRRDHADRIAGTYADLYRTAAVLRITLGLVAILGLFLAFYYPNVLRVLASAQTRSENETLYPALLEYSAAINGGSVRRIGYAVEFTAILSVIVISFVSDRRNWHRRFATYRYIAEHLRQMPLLLPIGESVGRAPAGPFATRDVDWPNWYIRMVARSLGPPELRTTEAFVSAARRYLLDLLADQIEFYESKSRKFGFIAQRLEVMATGCFYLGVVTALLRLITAFFFPDKWQYDILLNLGCLFFPSFAPFFLGLRAYGEYPKLSQRYAAMATNLRLAAVELQREDIPFADLADTSRRVASMMLEEVQEWQILIKGQGISRY